MEENKIDYVREYYKNKNKIDYKEFIENNINVSVDNDNILNIKKELKSLQDLIELKREQLEKENEKQLGKMYKQLDTKIIINYRGHNGNYYYDFNTCNLISLDDRENCIIYETSVKTGDFDILVGYNLELGLLYINKYDYRISTDNSKIKLKLVNIDIINILDNEKYCVEPKTKEILKSTLTRWNYRNVDITEYLEKFYNVKLDTRFSLYGTLEYLNYNKSFENIIRYTNGELQDLLLNLKVEESKPINELIGTTKDIYNNLVSKDLVLPFYKVKAYIKNNRVNFDKSDFELMEILERLRIEEDNLQFYKISYNYNYSYDNKAKRGDLAKLLISCYNNNIKDNYSFNKYTDYVINETINQGYTSVRDFLRELQDYLNMAKTLNIKPTLYSSYLKLTHDITSRNYNIKIEEESENVFKSRYKDFETYTYKDYSIIAPSETNDLKEEGSRLNHCVASYIKRVIDNQCLILFMRKTDNINDSLITIEINGDSIVQVKGSHNRKPTKEEMEILDKFSQDREYRLRY